MCCQVCWCLDCHLVISERNDPSLQRLPYPWPGFSAGCGREPISSQPTRRECWRAATLALACDRFLLLPMSFLPLRRRPPMSGCSLFLALSVGAEGHGLLISAYAQLPEGLIPLAVGVGRTGASGPRAGWRREVVWCCVIHGFPIDYSSFLRCDAILCFLPALKECNTLLGR